GDGLGAHPVQTGRHLVRALVELGPGAHGRQDDFERGPLGFGVFLDGDAPAVVGNAGTAVHVDFDMNVLAVAGEGLVDAVVDQLVDQVVQAVDAGVADIDAGPAADVGRVAQNLNVVFAVVAVAGRGQSAARGEGNVENFLNFFSHSRFLLSMPTGGNRWAGNALGYFC